MPGSTALSSVLNGKIKIRAEGRKETLEYMFRLFLTNCKSEMFGLVQGLLCKEDKGRGES